MIKLDYYRIPLQLKEGYALPDGIPQSFQCRVSTPSEHVEAGSTKESGLTFLDENGTPMNNPTFHHIPYFRDQIPNAPVLSQVEHVVYIALLQAKQIGCIQMPIRVSYINTEYK